MFSDARSSAHSSARSSALCFSRSWDRYFVLVGLVSWSSGSLSLSFLRFLVSILACSLVHSLIDLSLSLLGILGRSLSFSRHVSLSQSLVEVLVESSRLSARSSARSLVHSFARSSVVSLVGPLFFSWARSLSRWSLGILGRSPLSFRSSARSLHSVISSRFLSMFSFLCRSDLSDLFGLRFSVWSQFSRIFLLSQRAPFLCALSICFL